MKRLATALVLIPLVLLAVFRAPDWLFAVLVGLVATFALAEYLTIVESYGLTSYRPLTFGLNALIYAVLAVTVYTGAEVITLLLAPLVVLLFGASIYLAIGMRAEDLRTVLPGVAVSYFGIPYIGMALACLALLHFGPFGWFQVLFTFFTVWAGDTAAYYVGRSIGRIKFAPRISPKKTWEGAIASIAGAVVVGVLFSQYIQPIGRFLVDIHVLAGSSVYLSMDSGATRELLIAPPIWIPALLAAIINVAAQLGDLFESLIKRGGGVKDSGTILPGHGGILDRIDALLFAAPVALVLFMFFSDKFLQLP